MSDSCTRANPSIADPSNPMPSVKAASSSAGATDTLLRVPSTSVNQSRTNRMSRSSSVRSTNSCCRSTAAPPGRTDPAFHPTHGSATFRRLPALTTTTVRAPEKAPMPAPFDHRRRPEPLLRRRTVLGGAVLGTVLLLVLGVLGGITLPSVGSATTEEPERSMGSSGPLVAVQPRPSSPTGPPLLEAAPLPPPAPPAAASSAPPSPPPSPTPAPEQGRLAALCRALFENPTDLWELLGSLARRPATSQPDPGTPAPTAVAWEEDTPDRSRPDWLRQ